MLLSIAFLLLVAVVIGAVKGIVIVPERNAYVVEHLGRFERTLGPGLHILLPFIQRIAYRHSLKELAVDTEAHDCITQDNVQVSVDGILYLRIIDAKLASYGTHDYCFSATQLAQTLVRSEIGQLDLDRTFAERARISHRVVQELDIAAKPWGVKVLRYEIQHIRPSVEILEAMEKQVRAERERRAAILSSEGVRDARINEAKGHAASIEAVSRATATGLKEVGEALHREGGREAMQLRIAEQYVAQLGHLAKETTSLVVPANLTNLASMISVATTVVSEAER
jgi:regulator of protease activity HflC (stomatin/prohibitin superfamily)